MSRAGGGGGEREQARSSPESAYVHARRSLNAASSWAPNDLAGLRKPHTDRQHLYQCVLALEASLLKFGNGSDGSAREVAPLAH